MIRLAIALALAVSALCAHEVRPGFLQLHETAPGRYSMLWKMPVGGETRLALEPRLPATCTQLGEPRSAYAGGALIERRRLACEPQLSGAIVILGLERTLTDVLIRIEPLSGEIETRLATPSAPSVVIGAVKSVAGLWSYSRLGVQHILLGIDHLLFVLGLLLIVADRWMLLKTISAFTVAHSITLAVATLGYAHAPAAPLNAAIALSIFFLGPEIVRTWRGESSWTIRHPWAVAFAFGLLHGFGFAGGLTALGLPADAIPQALLLFNLGVEIGQLCFVGLILLLAKSFAALELRWPRWIELAPGYAVGSLGAFWSIGRVAALWP